MLQKNLDEYCIYEAAVGICIGARQNSRWSLKRGLVGCQQKKMQVHSMLLSDENENVCCQRRMDGVLSALPFGVVMATGWYDGPTEGFTECSVCHQPYSFQKLGWDENQDWRIISLSPISVSLEEIASKLELTLCPPRITIIALDEYNDFLSELLVAQIKFVTVLDSWRGCSDVWKQVGDANHQSHDDLISRYNLGWCNK